MRLRIYSCFHIIGLPKLPQTLKEDCSDIELWARFINAERKEEFDMLVQKDPYIESAYEHLQVISQDREKRLEYEARQKAIMDHNQMMREAEERGRKAEEKVGEDWISELIRISIVEGKHAKLARASESKEYRDQLLEHYRL